MHTSARSISILLFMSVLASCAQAPKAIEVAAKETLPTTWRLNSVIDGDTAIILCGSALQLKEDRVRLLRIDTPEKGEEDYRVARDVLEQLLTGQEFTLAFEAPDQEERDKFNRLLAYIFVDGVNINIEMVRQGQSRFWKKYGEEKRGIWGGGDTHD